MKMAIFVAFFFGFTFGSNPVFAFQKGILKFPAKDQKANKKIVLMAGDEEYRTEESMPMLGKILSQKHGFDCVVLFSLSEDRSYIDPNNQKGVVGLEELNDADLLIIGTRFRRPSKEQAAHITKFLNAGKPIIGIRTSTHAFNGGQSFGGDITYGNFGRKILGEQWVRHHGRHKVQGCRSVTVEKNSSHPILSGVGPIFAPSDVYGVDHLTEKDKVLLRAEVTETLDPQSKAVNGKQNDPLQAFAWIHSYTAPNGKIGTSLCTTGGASVDLVDENLRRLIVNAAYHFTGRKVLEKANVDYVDPFYPSFYGFIRDKDHFKNLNLQPEDFGLGKSPALADPKGTPEWEFRPRKKTEKNDVSGPLNFSKGQKIAFVGNSLAERMNLFGQFETLLHTRFPNKDLVVRNFGWPADEVAIQNRPGSYTVIDDPLKVYAPDMFLCFFGFNESFAGPNGVKAFVANYRNYIKKQKELFTRLGNQPQFVLVSPIAFESSGNPLQPSGEAENQSIKLYSDAIRDLAQEDGHRFVDVFSPSLAKFKEKDGLQFTDNGVHLDRNGDTFFGNLLDNLLFQAPHPDASNADFLNEVRKWVNDKSWFHLQDYRMLNGWYVYGGRRTWDKQTFPTEYRKIRKIVSVRDQYIWDLVSGKRVPLKPDDSNTGEVFNPKTMFGTRSEGFRKMREPKEVVYPTPEESIKMMKVPEGFEVQAFASEKDFPELANPNQIAFDNKGRLWVSCMVNYPQWQPGAPKPNDRLLIFEDTDKDGKADKCIPFYDKLICPTGFEFVDGGVLVVDEPRILFLKDTDGDDKADVVKYVLDGIATDDTHHTVGAWEFSHGGLLHMLEGVSMSTTIETPWGPFRRKGASGCYVWNLDRMKFSHFRTPGYGNPWCMVFDQWGNGIIGDGTNARQHWTTPLSGYPVSSRKTLRPVFDNHGMRPAVGSEFLLSRHFPDSVQGQFVYACVINMHGMPRFTVRDEKDGAGMEGERIGDLLSSTDMIFRPVDPKIGPDGALWFGDWCNALIGHMQYSQRDPNRDHEHGRIYRLVYKKKPLTEEVLQHGKSVKELVDQLETYELRTRYRVRRELRDRDQKEVLTAMQKWVNDKPSPMRFCEFLWMQESFHAVTKDLVAKMMTSKDFHARAAAVHTVTNQRDLFPGALEVIVQASEDVHPRVRAEAIRGLSYFHNAEALMALLKSENNNSDYWLNYTKEHTLNALEPIWKKEMRNPRFAMKAGSKAMASLVRHQKMNGPGGAAVLPLEVSEDVDQPMEKRLAAINQLAGLRGGNGTRGKAVFQAVCSSCHQVEDLGTKFGPDLSDIGQRMSRKEITRSVILPNHDIAKGYETVLILDLDGKTHTGFILSENDKEITLGVSDGKGEGKKVVINKEDIEERQDMKASSMPEGLMATIAPIEFLDLIQFLAKQKDVKRHVDKDGFVYAKSKKPGTFREMDGFQEISRTAGLLMKSDFPSHWREEDYLFFSPAPTSIHGFAFHSPHDVKHPHVIAKLDQVREIRRIELENRTNSQFWGRAKGLAVWVSNDGQSWTEVWASKKPQKVWKVSLPEGTKGKFVKIGLKGTGTFHLNGGTIYGK